MTIADRRSDILNFIVDEYISLGTPVSSGKVADRIGLGVSSATIRTEMGWLCEAGYLNRPHASSGAVPSATGYRHFVDGLAEMSPPPELEGLFQSEPRVAAEDLDAWARMASEMIADLIGTLAFITSPRMQAPTVRSVELVAVHDMLIRLLVVLQGAEVFRGMIETDREVAPDEIDRARNFVTSKVAGRTVADLIDVDAAADDADASAEPLCTLAWAATMETLMQSHALPGRRHVSGHAKMLAEPDVASDPEIGVAAMEALEDDATFGTIISTASSDGSPVVAIGPQDYLEGMENLSVIMCSYGQLDDVRGVVGLMGPLRVHYERAIPAVNYTAERMGEYVDRIRSA